MTGKLLTEHHLEFLILSGGCTGLMGKRELVALLSLSSWCLVMDVWLFLAVPWVCLRCVVVVFPGHTHLLFLSESIHVKMPHCWEFTCRGSIVVFLLLSQCHGYRGFSHNVNSFFVFYQATILI